MKKDKKNTNNSRFKEDIQKIVDDTMKNLKSIVDVNTVLGDPITVADGTIIIPISKIIVGFVSGGGEFSSNNPKMQTPNYPFAGGSGSGFTVIPLGFLTGGNGGYRFISIDNGGYTEFLNLANNLMNTIIEGLKNR